jgi:hypothetical protein
MVFASRFSTTYVVGVIRVNGYHSAKLRGKGRPKKKRTAAGKTFICKAKGLFFHY